MGAVLFMVGMQKQADFVKKQPPNFIYTGEKKMVLRVRTQGVSLACLLCLYLRAFLVCLRRKFIDLDAFLRSVYDH